VTVRSSRVRRRALAVTVLVLAAGATAACSPEAGAAAVVEGDPIPVEDVQAAADQLAPYLQGATPSGVLLVLVAEPTVAQIAAENGVAVSQQQAERLLTDLASDSPDAPEFSDASVAVARFSLLQQELGELPDPQAVQDDILARLQDLDIDVNPRYGALDFSRGGIVPAEQPWLVPAAS
jgi:hypothetical protein